MRFMSILAIGRAGLLCLPLLMSSAIGRHASAEEQFSVCFTPGQDCTSVIVHELDTSRHSVLVQAYSFTSTSIAQALVDAHKRGVDVRVILDKSQRSERYTAATFLANAGVPVWIDSPPGIAHNKVMVIDDSTVITGSFNFTKAAQEKNAENLLVIHDGTLTAAYKQNFGKRMDVSKPYSR